MLKGDAPVRNPQPQVPYPGLADGGGEVTGGLDGGSMKPDFRGARGDGEVMLFLGQVPSPKKGDKLKLPGKKIEPGPARGRGKPTSLNLFS